MASHHLVNHLRMFRKRSALSQEEVAFLLGSQSGAKVCRYELFSREPGLQTILAFVAVFGRPVEELFPGLFEKIQGEVKKRAARLEQKERAAPAGPMTTRKCQALGTIISAKPKKQS